MKDPKDMTIVELKEYVNALEFPELEKFADTFEIEEVDIDLDVLDLLKASRLYDYLQWKEGGNARIELQCVAATPYLLCLKQNQFCA